MKKTDGKLVYDRLGYRHISVLQYRGSPHAVALQACLEAFPPDEVATTVITAQEQMRGWLGLLPGQGVNVAHTDHLDVCCR